ncbi:MAG: DUF11 domain-containing protein [Oscillospiraceae bacterium]|nr:DUF11 domain-containing protein [Oscillospiraceae bacterium]
MKNLKQFGRRSLAMVLAFIMCMSMLQLTAFATDELEVNDAPGIVDSQPVETPEVPEETLALPEETPEVPEETLALPEETPEVPEETAPVEDDPAAMVPVNVEQASTNTEPTSSQTIYVYVVREDGKGIEGIDRNQHGWYTVGTLEMTGFPDPSEYEYENAFGPESELVSTVVAQLGSGNAGNVDRYNNNTIVIAGDSEITVEWRLIRSKGATDYTPGEYAATWHLDGVISEIKGEPAPDQKWPEVDVTKTPEKTEYQAGDTITWTITVENNGFAAAEGLVLTDALEGVTIVPDVGTFDLGIGESKTFTATLENAPEGTYTNKVTVTGNTNEGSKPVEAEAPPVTVEEAEKSITLSYDALGGEGAPEPETKTVKVGESAVFTVSTEEPTREGYTFKGWQKGTAVVTGELTIDKDTTLYAKWEKDPTPTPKYKVTWSFEEGTPEALLQYLPEGGDYAEGDEVGVRDYGVFPIDGKIYSFNGWQTEANVTITEGKFTMPAADVAWTGSWTATDVPAQPDTYTVQWVNGYETGTKGTIKGMVLSDGTDYADQYPADPTREGYRFTGWSAPVESVDGVGKKVLTITAEWEALPAVGYTLTINYVYENGGVAYAQYSAQLEEGKEYNVPSPTIDGYTPSVLQITGSMPASDTGYTVVYRPVPAETYTLTINYLYSADRSEAAEPYVREQLAEGTAYSVPSPGITGYRASPSVVTGAMPAGNVVIDVLYTVVDGGGDYTPPPTTDDDDDGDDDDGYVPVVPPVDDNTPPVVDVPDEDVPLAEVPEVVVPDEEVPLAEVPEVDVPDEEAPLAEVPETIISDGEVPLAEVPEVIIPDEEVPLAEVPEMIIPDEEVPLAEVPEVEEIPEALVPLAEVPKTGDSAYLWAVLAISSGAGLAWLVMDEKKRKAEAK